MASTTIYQGKDTAGNPVYESSTYGGAVNPSQAITSAALQPQAAIALPPAPVPTDPTHLVAGGNAIVGANTATLTPPATDTTATPDPYASLKDMISSIGAPPSASAQYNTDYASSGIDAAQGDLNTKNAAVKAAQSKLAATNAQIAGITAQGQVMNLQQEGRVGALTSQVSGQQAENNRQMAIKAIPLQVQALANQAEIASAQGSEALAQGILQQAQSHLDTMYSLHMQDLQQQYKYKSDLIQSVYSFADKQEQRQLDSLKLKQQQDFTVQQNTIAYQRDIEKAKLDEQLKRSSPLYQAQIASANRANQPSPTDGLLSVSEAQALGVPYGTTKSQAMGKTPQKPPTEGQQTTSLYANRIEQSNAILSKLDKTVATANPVLWGGQGLLPNSLKSGDFQSIEQAQRNFVNAVLRKESGAAISPTEFDSAAKQYFTQPGDTPETIAQKKANRDLVQQGFVSGSGSAYTPLTTTTTTKSGAAFDVAAAKATGYTDQEIQAYLAAH